MVRGALAALLALEPDLEAVAQVAAGDRVVPIALRAQPDVALLDIEMPGINGIEAAARLHQELPDCRVIIITTFGRPAYLRQAMEAGASGFLVKDAPAERLADAIRRATSGQPIIDPELAAAAIQTSENPFTPRERDVLKASEDGSPIADVAPPALPVGRHRAQLPLLCNRQDRRPQPHRGPAARPRTRLDLTENTTD